MKFLRQIVSWNYEAISEFCVLDHYWVRHLNYLMSNMCEEVSELDCEAVTELVRLESSMILYVS